jgi:IS30 family transposase
MRISHEAIYQWVYADPRTPNLWHEQLRRRHRRRKPHRPAGAAKPGQIIGRIGIEDRPAVVERRTRLGDWESDTLQGAPGSGGLATHVERRTRLLLAAKLDDRSATHFARRSLGAFRAAGLAPGTLPGTLPGAFRGRCCRTLTADNGKEFADFKLLERDLGLRVYFARPYAAWERGTCENTNGLLRDYFPKGIDFTTVSKRQVARTVRSLNNRPRKCLGYRTPSEVFSRLAGVALQI